MLKAMIARLVCKWKGCLRGRFVRYEGNKRITACPRCGKERAWAKKGEKE